MPPYEKGSDGRYRSFTSILQCYTRNLSIRHPLYIHTILTINNPGRFIIMPLCSLSTTAQKHSRVGLHFQSFLCLAQAEGEWSASPLSLSLSHTHTHTHHLTATHWVDPRSSLKYSGENIKSLSPMKLLNNSVRNSDCTMLKI